MTCHMQKIAWFPSAFRLSLSCRGREATGQKVQLFVRQGIGLPVIPDAVNPACLNEPGVE